MGQCEEEETILSRDKDSRGEWLRRKWDMELFIMWSYPKILKMIIRKPHHSFGYGSTYDTDTSCEGLRYKRCVAHLTVSKLLPSVLHDSAS